MTAFAREHDLARLAVDDGYGAQTLWEPEPVTITLSGVPVAAARRAPSCRRPRTARRRWSPPCARRWRAPRSSPISSPASAPSRWRSTGKVYAAEGARDAALALKAAGRGRLRRASRSLPPPARRRPSSTGSRRSILDPPRAGAKEQVAALAASPVPRIAYVSCNPNTFARDAKSADRRAATGSIGCSRSASSAGRPMSSWRRPSPANGARARCRGAAASPRHGRSGRAGRTRPARRAGSASARRWSVAWTRLCSTRKAT